MFVYPVCYSSFIAGNRSRNILISRKTPTIELPGFRQQRVTESLPSCKSIRIYLLIRYSGISRLLYQQYVCRTYEPVHIVAFSLPSESWQLNGQNVSPEGCGFDSRLGLRNIFLSLRLSLSSKQFTFKLPSCKSFHIQTRTCLTSSKPD